MNHWQFILEMQLYLMVLEKSGKYDEGISILKDDNEGIFIFEVLKLPLSRCSQFYIYSLYHLRLYPWQILLEIYAWTKLMGVGGESPPSFKICHFAGKNGSTMYFCRATD